MNFDLSNKKKLVIKIGSSLLVENGELRKLWLQKFTKDVAQLVEQGIKITIVSSGAIALGRSILKVGNRKLSIEEKQAAAAVGQIQLMGFYRDLFQKHELEVAQILLTAADCNSRERYLNSKNTIETLLQHRVIPIINENDTVAVDEIKIGDNDRLAARVAQMISADLMVLFSDIDGLYDKNPKSHSDAKLIRQVFAINKEIEEMAGGAVSAVGTGGMITKIMAAKMLEKSACDVAITNGIADGALGNFFKGNQNFTIFYCKKSDAKSRRNWISGVLNAKGSLVINECAVETLKNKKISLLPVGIVEVKGHFKAGEVVFVRDELGNHIASGISNFDAADVSKVLQKKTEEVKKILGDKVKKEVIHLDNLVIL